MAGDVIRQAELRLSVKGAAEADAELTRFGRSMRKLADEQTNVQQRIMAAAKTQQPGVMPAGDDLARMRDYYSNSVRVQRDFALRGRSAFEQDVRDTMPSRIRAMRQATRSAQIKDAAEYSLFGDSPTKAAGGETGGGFVESIRSAGRQASAADNPLKEFHSTIGMIKKAMVGFGAIGLLKMGWETIKSFRDFWRERLDAEQNYRAALAEANGLREYEVQLMMTAEARQARIAANAKATTEAYAAIASEVGKINLLTARGERGKAVATAQQTLQDELSAANKDSSDARQKYKSGEIGRDAALMLLRGPELRRARAAAQYESTIRDLGDQVAAKYASDRRAAQNELSERTYRIRELRARAAGEDLRADIEQTQLWEIKQINEAKATYNRLSKELPSMREQFERDLNQRLDLIREEASTMRDNAQKKEDERQRQADEAFVQSQKAAADRERSALESILAGRKFILEQRASTGDRAAREALDIESRQEPYRQQMERLDALIAQRNIDPDVRARAFEQRRELQRMLEGLQPKGPDLFRGATASAVESRFTTGIAAASREGQAIQEMKKQSKLLEMIAKAVGVSADAVKKIVLVGVAGENGAGVGVN